MPLTWFITSIQSNHVQVSNIFFASSFNMPSNVNNHMPGGIDCMPITQIKIIILTGRLTWQVLPNTIGHISMPQLGKLGVSTTNVMPNGDLAWNHLSARSPHGMVQTSNQPI